jgi:hypothetical protein
LDINLVRKKERKKENGGSTMAHTFKVTISDDELKAFNLIVPDADEWVDNAVRNKVRKCFIYVAEEATKDISSNFDPTDLAEIQAEMEARGDIMKAPKDWSEVVKGMIVNKVKMKTRKERGVVYSPTTQPPNKEGDTWN